MMKIVKTRIYSSPFDRLVLKKAPFLAIFAYLGTVLLCNSTSFCRTNVTHIPKRSVMVSETNDGE